MRVKAETRREAPSTEFMLERTGNGVIHPPRHLLMCPCELLPMGHSDPQPTFWASGPTAVEGRLCPCARREASSETESLHDENGDAPGES